jgi:hypothetical protein
MTTPDELIKILDRVLDGSRDEKDITLLRHYLGAINNSQISLSSPVAPAAR